MRFERLLNHFVKMPSTSPMFFKKACGQKIFSLNILFKKGHMNFKYFYIACPSSIT